METSVLKNWWLLTFNGMVAILFGIFVLLYPGITLMAIATYFGFLALFLAAFLVIAAILNRHHTDLWMIWLLEGILNLLIGIAILSYPEISVTLFLMLLGIWALLIGAIQIISVAYLKNILAHRRLYFINGLIGVAFGIILFIRPFESVLVITMLIGAYIVLLGIFSLLISFRMKKNRQQIEETTTETFRLH